MFFLVRSLELNTSDVKIYGGTQEVKEGSIPLINLSSLRHLQHVTIRAAVYYEEQVGDAREHYFISYLPTIVKIFKTAPLLQHLTIDIKVDLPTEFLSKVKFPVFTALANSSASFHHVDLYIRGISDTEIVSLLGEYGCVSALIEQGVLVIHMDEEAPPGDSRFLGSEWRKLNYFSM